MRIATNGTFRSEAFGWFQDKDTAPGVLLAPTFILLGSILIVVLTLMMTRGFNEPDGNHHFDPGNILHVIAASSAGGMQEPFPPFNEDQVEFSQSVDIQLGPLDGPGGERLGFVHAK